MSWQDFVTALGSTSDVCGAMQPWRLRDQGGVWPITEAPICRFDPSKRYENEDGCHLMVAQGTRPTWLSDLARNLCT